MIALHVSRWDVIVGGGTLLRHSIMHAFILDQSANHRPWLRKVFSPLKLCAAIKILFPALTSEAGRPVAAGHDEDKGGGSRSSGVDVGPSP